MLLTQKMAGTHHLWSACASQAYHRWEYKHSIVAIHHKMQWLAVLVEDLEDLVEHPRPVQGKHLSCSSRTPCCRCTRPCASGCGCHRHSWCCKWTTDPKLHRARGKQQNYKLRTPWKSCNHLDFWRCWLAENDYCKCGSNNGLWWFMDVYYRCLWIVLILYDFN